MALGIVNRTENWKTARSLSPLFGDKAHLLAQRLGEQQPENVSLELFWKGARDYCAQEDREAARERLFAGCEQFGSLRQRVEEFDGFQELQPHNYDFSSDHTEQLVDNLVNTEIDIVLESSQKLYIGEAKVESGFDAASKYVLVHQLIRQYVMAKILVDIRGEGRQVVPFLVTEEGASARAHQVRFMVEQGWMEPSHMLTWTDVRNLAAS